jgi:hypothetical protein
MIKAEYNSSMFDDLANLVESNDELKVHRGVIGIRKILTQEINPPIK